MADDPFFCENCDEDLSHDDIETVAPIPRVDVDSFDVMDGAAEVYKCADCGLVIGFDRTAP